MDMKIIDKKGEWFVNTAMYRFVDGENGNVFEPGVPTKVTKTKWMEGQPLIVSAPDPSGDEEMPQVIVPVDSVLVPNNVDTGQPDVNAAAGVAGTAAVTDAKSDAKPDAKKK